MGYSLIYPKLLTKYGMMACCEMINILEDFLNDRKQRVVLNGQFTSWADLQAGVPQGSILGPLLYLIPINDLSNDIKSKCKCLLMTNLCFL